MTKSMSETGLSRDNKKLKFKVSKKKAVEKGYPTTVTYDDTKYQLLCACNAGKDGLTKSKRKQKTQPVLAYKIDPKLRDNCEICHVPPHVVMKRKDVADIEKAFEDAK